MLIALSDSGLRALYQDAASTLGRGIGADRTAIFYRDAQGALNLGGTYGMPSFPINDCPLSLSVIEAVLTDGRTLLYSNVPKDSEASDNVSLQLSGAVSLLCVPYYDAADKPAGALYADTSARHGAFHRRELLFARDCANWLECCLAGRDNLPKPEPILTGSRSPSGRAPGGSLVSTPSRPKRSGPSTPIALERVRPEELLVFLRSLATLTRAGITIYASLEILAEGAESKSMAKISTELAVIVVSGEPLSAAMERFPKVFSAPLRTSICMGERTGRLVHVLDVMATDLEKGQRLTYRVRSALTYPAFLSVACALMLIFGPPYLLEGHLRMLADSGMTLPFLTRALVGLSKLTGSLWFLLSLALALFGGAAWARSAGGREVLLRVAYRVPGVGPVLELLDRVHFVRALSLQLRAGMTVMEAFTLGRQSCHSARLKDALREAERALRDGATLSEAIHRTGHFDRVFLSCLQTGEEAGTLERSLSWLADFYERELETRLDGMVALIEPLVMAGMGAVAAVLMIATIKPTLLLMQTL